MIPSEPNEKIRPIRCHSNDSLFITGGAGGGGAGSAGRTGGAFEFSTDRESKGGHHPMDFFAVTFRTGNFFGGI
jgi:hypothetical protein